MHAFAGRPMLALTLSDIIFYIFMAIFIFGPWLAKVLKQASQQSGSPPSQPTRQVSADKQRSKQAGQFATQRQGKLEELARQRRLMRQQPKSTSPQPSNLTMAQQAQRDRAKRLYEKRAKKMGKKEAPPRPEPVGDAQSRSAADLQLQRQRQARLASAQSQAKQKRQAAAAYQAAKTGQSRSAAFATHYSDPKKHAKLHDEGTEIHTTHRLVADVLDPDQPVSVEGGGLHGMRARGSAMLRQAVIFKEIIDPPLALRDPVDSHTPATSI